MFCRGAEPSRPHPALKHDLDPAKRGSWETDAAPALALTEAELAARVPKQTPFITCDCPSCGRRPTLAAPIDCFGSIIRPTGSRAAVAKRTFPNERFPNNRTATFLNTIGESIEIPCYVDAAGKQFYLSSTIDTWRNDELRKQIAAMAKLYAVTKNEECARRIVVLLAAYAEHFPHYLVKDFKTSTDDPPGKRGAQRSWYEFVSTGGPG